LLAGEKLRVHAGANVVADDVCLLQFKGLREAFDDVRLLDERVTIRGGLVRESIAREIEGSAAVGARQAFYDAAPIVAGGWEAMEHVYYRAATALIHEDALAFDLKMAAGGKPTAGGFGEVGFVHGAPNYQRILNGLEDGRANRVTSGQALTGRWCAAKIGT